MYREIIDLLRSLGLSFTQVLCATHNCLRPIYHDSPDLLEGMLDAP
jgi:hypothetical protein